MTSAELEEALVAEWSYANLAVYADFLQSHGDPRGDWMAMDLSLVRDGARGATQDECERVLAPFRAHVTMYSRLACGFIDLLAVFGTSEVQNLSSLVRTLESPIGRYVRAIEVSVGARLAKKAVAAIASAPRPWLRRLAIDLSPRREELALGDDLLAALGVAAPRLEAVDLDDQSARFASRSLTKLAIEVAGTSTVLDLGRVRRMHGGTVDEMSPQSRDAWADLWLAIAELEYVAPRDGRRSLPAATLRAVIDAIALDSFWGRDWAAIAEALARRPGDPVVLRRAS